MLRSFIEFPSFPVSMSAVHPAAFSTRAATPLMTVGNLDFRRGTRIIFQNVDLETPHGKITAIMEPSGVGKTTSLRLIGSKIRLDASRIEVDSVYVHELCRRELYPLRKRMRMLFQSGALFTVKLDETGSGRSASKESRS